MTRHSLATIVGTSVGRSISHTILPQTQGPVSRALLLRTGGLATALALAICGGAYAAVQVARPSPTGMAAPAAHMSHRTSTASHEHSDASAHMTTPVAVAGQSSVISTVTDEAEQPYQTVEEETDTLPAGQRQVATAGVAGMTRTTYQVTTVGGVEMTRDVLAQVNVTPVVNEIVLVGTRTTPTPHASSAGASAAGADVWAALAQCESSGNPQAVSSGGHYGLYQFSPQTWASLGGVGLPTDASPEEQTAMAQRLQARSGWGQWPACAASLGLL